MVAPNGAIGCAMHMTDGLVSTNSMDGMDAVLRIWGNGCVELFVELAKYAVEADKLFHATFDTRKDGCPGVYDYEVSYEFGAWFGKYILESGDAPDWIAAPRYGASHC